MRSAVGRLWAIAWLAAGCTPVAPPGSTAALSPRASASALGVPAGGAPTGSQHLPSQLAPLCSDRPYVSLPVAGHRPAVVSLPRGASAPRPVIVAAHGAGGRPDWQCELWRRLVGDDAFVLCVTGAAMYSYEPDGYAGYFYTGHPALAQEISAAWAALLERYPDYVDPVDPVFAGYSQGAIMGALILPTHPVRFARAVLIEGGFGGFQEWNVAVARRYAEHGGHRVLLACGRARCVTQADTTARYLVLGGLEAQVVFARGAGHGYGWPMERELRAALPWLLAGDRRWALAPPPR